MNLVPVLQVDDAFKQCEEFFQRAIERGEADDLTLSELHQECRSGRAFLYVKCTDHITDAIVIRFEPPSLARVLAMGGEGGCNWPEELEALTERIKNYADRLVFQGRKGWERVLPNARVKAQVYEMQISGDDQ